MHALQASMSSAILDENGATNSVAPPLVTVLMTVFNTASFLREAIDSILNQTFTDFEFLIYNDGSTDDTAAVVLSYTDPRIVLINSTVNRGVSLNMNEGIERAKGRYIVRMDGDDIAHSDRIAKQVAYLEAHPAVGLCGSAVRYIGASDGCIYPPQDNTTIQHTMWLQNAFFQPAVTIRASVLRDHKLRYDSNYDPAEDYKLWSDMSAFTELYNLGEVLLDYRIHPHQISRRQSAKQQQASAQIRREQMRRLHIWIKPEQEAAYDLLTIDDGWLHFSQADYTKVAALLDNLRAQSRQLGIPPEVADNVMSQQWGRILNAARQYRPAMMPFVMHRSLSRYLPKVMLLKLLAKCLISWKIIEKKHD